MNDIPASSNRKRPSMFQTNALNELGTRCRTRSPGTRQPRREIQAIRLKLNRDRRKIKGGISAAGRSASRRRENGNALGNPSFRVQTLYAPSCWSGETAHETLKVAGNNTRACVSACARQAALTMMYCQRTLEDDAEMCPTER